MTSDFTEIRGHRSFQRERAFLLAVLRSCDQSLASFNRFYNGGRVTNFLILQLNSQYKMILKTFEVRNRHYSNRILIHIWWSRPSLTVWLEFASDWQPALIDGSWQRTLFSIGKWNPSDAVRSTGRHSRTQRDMIFFRLPVSCTTVTI